MIGERLKELRTQLGHTQDSLAEVLNVDIRQVWRYENGESMPKGDMVARLAEALHTSADYILGLTDDPTPHDMAVTDLSPQERAVISAWRKGNKLEAIAVIVEG